jgi:hypothetical protein
MPKTCHGSNSRTISSSVDCNNIRACELLPCVLNPFHFDLLFRIVQIVRQHAKRTVPKEQVNLLKCELLGFL